MKAKVDQITDSKKFYITLPSLFGVTAILFSIASCTSIPLAQESEDFEAKKFAAPSELSSIYIFRNEVFGGARKAGVLLDSKVMGETAPFTYFKWDVTPGRHLISCNDSDRRSVEVFSKKGSIIFVRQEILKVPSGLGCTVYEVSENEGRSAVESCRLGKAF